MIYKMVIFLGVYKIQKTIATEFFSTQFSAIPSELRVHKIDLTRGALTNFHITHQQRPSVSWVYFGEKQIYRHFDPVCYL